MPTTLLEAVTEAKAILARDEALQQMPEFVREAELATPGSIYAVDREVAVVLLARFIKVIEALDPEMVGPMLSLVGLERELKRRR